MFTQDKEREKWMMRAMYRAKYPDIAKLMDKVREHFPGATLSKVRELKTSGKLYLDCPYKDRDLVKKLGAKWDKSGRKWYVPEGIDNTPFKKWGIDNNLEGKEIKIHIDDLLKKYNKKKRR